MLFSKLDVGATVVAGRGFYVHRRALRISEFSEALAGVSGVRVQQLPYPARLPGEDRIRVRASDVSRCSFRGIPLRTQRTVALRPNILDDGLSTLGSAL